MYRMLFYNSSEHLNFRSLDQLDVTLDLNNSMVAFSEDAYIQDQGRSMLLVYLQDSIAGLSRLGVQSSTRANRI